MLGILFFVQSIDDLEELAKRDKRNYPNITAVNNSGTTPFFVVERHNKVHDSLFDI